MRPTDRFVLPSDVSLLPIHSVDPHLQSRLDGRDGDVVVSRARSRATSQLIDRDSADFLELFRAPTTIVDAVIRFAQPRDADPFEVLNESLPAVSKFLQAGFLVSEGDVAATPTTAALRAGDTIEGVLLDHEVQVLPDSEVWAGSLGSRPVALKLGRTPSGSAAVRREVQALERLGGVCAPALVFAGEDPRGSFVVSQWIEGVRLDDALRRVREPGSAGRRALIALLRDVVTAVAQLHEHGMIHGDIHPRNFVVSPDGKPVVLDYGLSHLQGYPDPGRGAVGHYVEPEYALALLENSPAPPASSSSDQYGVALIVFRGITGEHAIDLSLDRRRSWQQIATQPPRSFAAVGSPAWPGVEEVLSRALAKAPGDRFPNMTGFASALWTAAQTPPRRTRVLPTTAARLLDETVARYRVESIDELLLPPSATLNYGAAGIAYALLRIAQSRHDGEILAAADAWGQRALRDEEPAAYEAPDLGLPRGLGRSSSLLHGRPGVLYVNLLVGAAFGRAPGLLPNFLDTDLSGASFDATLGVASLLLGAAHLMETIGPWSGPARDQLGSAGSTLERRVLDALEHGPIVGGPVRYLGYAHGWAGLLHAVLRWREATKTDVPALVSERIHQLAAIAVRSRTEAWFPVEADPSTWSSPPWPGWCHGSAGHAILMISGAKALRDERLFELAAALGRHVAHRSDGRTGQICCGLAGQAYALASLGRVTHEPYWARQAGRLADKASRVVNDESAHRRGSLFKGDLGVALLVNDLGGDARFPIVEG